MDFTVLYVIGATIIASALFYGFHFLRKKGYVTDDDLKFVSDTFKISMEIVNEMNLKQENQIKSITDVIILSLDYAMNENNVDENKAREIAIQYCYDLCGKFAIELTENRKNIINELIDFGIQTRFAEKIASTTTSTTPIPTPEAK